MIDQYPYYIVAAWVWNISQEEYKPETIAKTKSYSKAAAIYESITPDIDKVQIELWVIDEDSNERLKYKEAIESEVE